MNGKRWTFENYVVGESNEFAYVAAQCVANNPGNAYNPLTIYGEKGRHGLGKTHLLHAIEEQLKDKGLNAVYLTGDQFTEMLIDALTKHGTAEPLREYLRSLDAIAIDDLDEITGRESTMKELYALICFMVENGKQVVIGCGIALDELPEGRTGSMLQAGLMADIQPMDAETAGRFLQEKAKEKGLQLTEAQTSDILGKNTGDARPLLGELNAIALRQEFMK